MFSFFNRSAKLTDVSWIGTDIHSHILPGIDDGIADADTALEYVRFMHSLGYRRLIFTPHIYSEFFPNTPEIISTVFQRLKNMVDEQGIDIDLSFAAEYMLDAEFLTIIRNESYLCLKDNYILIELPFVAELMNATAIVGELMERGLIPVLAHPERYVYYHKNASQYTALKDAGCLFQANILSFSGYYGASVKNAAQRLLEHGYIDLVGTDLHHAKHREVLQSFVRSGRLHQKLSRAAIKNHELFGW